MSLESDEVSLEPVEPVDPVLSLDEPDADPEPEEDNTDAPLAEAVGAGVYAAAAASDVYRSAAVVIGPPVYVASSTGAELVGVAPATEARYEAELEPYTSPEEPELPEPELEPESELPDELVLSELDDPESLVPLDPLDPAVPVAEAMG